MPNTYFFVARPETIASVIYTGRTPDVLPDYIKERSIKLYTSHQEALESNKEIAQRQSYLMAINLPDESDSAITVIREGKKEYKQATQLNLNWLSKIYVGSLAAEKVINNLCNSWCKKNNHLNNNQYECLPIEIKTEWFDKQVASKASIVSLSEQPAFFSSASASVITETSLQRSPLVHYLKDGDVFQSKMQVLVNTVNCVGAMGRGIAKEFKEKYPAMFEDYKNRCASRELKTGGPYLYKIDETRWILNFPTKYHWANDSKLEWIEDGLQYLVEHAAEWGIQSMAFPPLGCGNGNLNWNDVYPVMRHYLDQLSIPIEIHSPWVEPKLNSEPKPVKKQKINPRTPDNDNSNDNDAGTLKAWVRK